MVEKIVDESAPVDRENLQLIKQEIFGKPHDLRGIRFTQDSPIMPETWLRFAEQPGGSHDMLINPCKGHRAGYVARDMRTLLDHWRDLKGISHNDVPARISHVPGLIAARLQFAPLMRIVLPSTLWWKLRMEELDQAFTAAGVKVDDIDDTKRELFDEQQLELLKKWMKQDWPPASLDENEGGHKVQSPEELEVTAPYDFLKMIRVAGLVMASDNSNQTGPHLASGELKLERGIDETDHLIDRFVSIYRDWPANPKKPPTGGIIWNVTMNRRAEPAIADSTRTMKADAGRRLFNMECKTLRWAVIDSGIDATHPAFSCLDDGDFLLPPITEEYPTPQKTRVVHTFDFSELRLLLDPIFLRQLRQSIFPNLQDKLPTASDHESALITKIKNRLFESADKRIPRAPIDAQGNSASGSKKSKKAKRDIEIKRAVKRQLRLLTDRIDQGLEVDWATIEPLIEDVTPYDPPRPHGTQVAGVLAANWIEESSDGTEKTIRAQGVCPDLRLIDLRVMAQDPDNPKQVAAHDFEVISAFKFIGYLNSRADEPYVHGANISIAIKHDVARFACGRTPICEEAEWLVSSGVVVVAAAGNGGYADSDTFDQRFYRTASITDPGNAEGVITVGSTHRHSPHQYGVSYFSSRGPTGDGRRKPDLVAPGEKITTPSPNRRLATVDGTSFAAPHVSGAAAMLMARHRELIAQPKRIKEVLCNSATCLGREPYFQGAGMVDVLRALQSI